MSILFVLNAKKQNEQHFEYLQTESMNKCLTTPELLSCWNVTFQMLIAYKFKTISRNVARCDYQRSKILNDIIEKVKQSVVDSNYRQIILSKRVRAQITLWQFIEFIAIVWCQLKAQNIYRITFTTLTVSFNLQPVFYHFICFDIPFAILALLLPKIS